MPYHSLRAKWHSTFISAWLCATATMGLHNVCPQEERVSPVAGYDPCC